MKRNMELVKEILSEVEARFDGGRPIELDIDGHSPEEISYHVMIMAEGGLLDAIDASARDFDWRARRLTWQGHEFLAAARNDTVWRKALQLVKDKGASVPFEVLKQLLLQGVRASLE